MGFSSDGVPWVGPLPHAPGQWLVAGFSGHGMPQTFLCGRAIAQMVLGRTPRPFVDRFLPSRRDGFAPVDA